MKLWRPAKCGAYMTAVQTRAAKLISGVRRDASHTAFFTEHAVNKDVMLAGLTCNVLLADAHCRMAHARRYAWQAAATAAVAL